MRRSPQLSLAVAALTLSGCYRYVPGTAADQAPGAEVRVELTPDGAQRLATVIGADIVSLTGRVLEVNDREVAMSVGRSLRRAGSEQSWTGERVTIPRDAIARTDRRTLDRKRTTLASLAAVLGAGLIGVILNSVSTNGNPGGGGAPPPPPA